MSLISDSKQNRIYRPRICILASPPRPRVFRLAKSWKPRWSGQWQDLSSSANLSYDDTWRPQGQKGTCSMPSEDSVNLSPLGVTFRLIPDGSPPKFNNVHVVDSNRCILYTKDDISYSHGRFVDINDRSLTLVVHKNRAWSLVRTWLVLSLYWSPKLGAAPWPRPTPQMRFFFLQLDFCECQHGFYFSLNLTS